MVLLASTVSVAFLHKIEVTVSSEKLVTSVVCRSVHHQKYSVSELCQKCQMNKDGRQLNSISILHFTISPSVVSIFLFTWNTCCSRVIYIYSAVECVYGLYKEIHNLSISYFVLHPTQFISDHFLIMISKCKFPRQ